MSLKVARGGNEITAWAGRAAAAIGRWSDVYAMTASGAVDDMLSLSIFETGSGLTKLRSLLEQARADLTFNVGPPRVVIQHHMVFDYFDELRKYIEPARVEAFFVDAHLDANFVARFLPFVAQGTAIRLLGGSKRMSTLLPAVEMFATQNGRSVEVRSSDAIHERYLFEDKTQCYFSGASFKDGAKTAPVLLSQVVDAFQPMWDTYNAAWQAAKVIRPA